MTRKYKIAANQNFLSQEQKTMMKSILSHSLSQMLFAKNIILRSIPGINIQDNFYAPNVSSPRT